MSPVTEKPKVFESDWTSTVDTSLPLPHEHKQTLALTWHWFSVQFETLCLRTLSVWWVHSSQGVLWAGLSTSRYWSPLIMTSLTPQKKLNSRKMAHTLNFDPLFTSHFSVLVYAPRCIWPQTNAFLMVNFNSKNPVRISTVEFATMAGMSYFLNKYIMQTGFN